MPLIDQRLGFWCGGAFLLLFPAGLLIAGFLPLPSPSLGAAEVAALYRAQPNLIRTGMVLLMLSAAPLLAFYAVISEQLRRIPGIGRATPYLQLGCGTAGAAFIMLSALVLAVVAFRPERDPQLLALLHDLGWLLFVTPFPFALIQNFAIATAILMDQGAQPVFPRWIAYFNIWTGLLFAPGGIAFFFVSGPFAWNGLLAFWLPAVVVVSWMLVMMSAVARAIRRQSEHAAEPATE